MPASTVQSTSSLVAVCRLALCKAHHPLLLYGYQLHCTFRKQTLVVSLYMSLMSLNVSIFVPAYVLVCFWTFVYFLMSLCFSTCLLLRQPSRSHITGDRHTMRNRASEIRQCYIPSFDYNGHCSQRGVCNTGIVVSGGYVTLSYLWRSVSHCVSVTGYVHDYTEQQQRGAYRNNTAESMNTAILCLISFH